MVMWDMPHENRMGVTQDVVQALTGRLLPYHPSTNKESGEGRSSQEYTFVCGTWPLIWCELSSGLGLEYTQTREQGRMTQWTGQEPERRKLGREGMMRTGVEGWDGPHKRSEKLSY